MTNQKYIYEIDPVQAQVISQAKDKNRARTKVRNFRP